MDARATGIASRNNPSVIDYVPNEEIETNWRVTSQRSDVKISVQGPFAKYAVLTRDFISEKDEDKTFKVIFRMPEKDKIEEPGKLPHSITVEEIVGNHGHSVGTAINVKWTIYFRVPYDGPYIETELSASNTAINKTSVFTQVVNNRGTTAVRGLSPRLDLYNSKLELIKTFYLKEISLEPKDKYEDSYVFDTTGFNPGEYKLVSTIDWAGKNTSRADFIIGSQSLRVADYRKNLTAGKIDKFIIEIFNDWDKVIYSVYAELAIGGETFKTSPITIGPWSTNVLDGYVDTRNLQPGETDAELRIYYDGKVHVEKLKLTVLKKESAFTATGAAGSSGAAEIFSVTNILIFTVILLVFVTLFMITKMGKVETLIVKQIEQGQAQQGPPTQQASQQLSQTAPQPITQPQPIAEPQLIMQQPQQQTPQQTQQQSQPPIPSQQLNQPAPALALTAHASKRKRVNK